RLLVVRPRIAGLATEELDVVVDRGGGAAGEPARGVQEAVVQEHLVEAAAGPVGEDVHLADRERLVAVLPQRGLHRHRVGVREGDPLPVPVAAGQRGGLPGEHRGPGGHAGGRGRVGAGEVVSAACEVVEVGGVDDLTRGGYHFTRAYLVDADE